MIAIFDSLTHPTISGSWLGKGTSNTFSSLINQLNASHFVGACAVGIYGKDGYNHESYIRACKQHSQLVPIAGFNPHVSNIKKEINYISELGFAGLKIHTILSNISIKDDHDILVDVFSSAAEEQLIVFLCTYYHCELSHYPEKDPFYSLVSILKSAGQAKVVLLHGGDVSLIQYAELVRFNPNLLLDLSYTIMKYAGSSLDLDIQYLFRTLDKKLCIGTDSPEYTQEQLRQRFESLSFGLPADKQENIAFGNITNFLKRDSGGTI